MRLKIFILCLVALFVSQTSKAQWVVTDPGNLAQCIINATKNIVHTSSTAATMLKSFQETVKIYEQGKEYYDALKKAKNLVRDARKVQQTILLVGDITDIYVIFMPAPDYRYEEYVRSEPPATNLIVEEEAAPADSLSDEKIREMEEFFNQFNSESYE